ncbi:acetate--CoA ligase family protein [Candidatus Micrarchaeota archaeon]|nr:acetate--CoA ligase family protein [Candidatus Micrarchaeota archaeon]MBU1930298.1 acetate--CoA ligase family protein [Candidatus Micrarchaeota archaeon]
MPTTLSLFDSLVSLQKFGIPTAPFEMVSKTDRLETATQKTGFPCVLKAISPLAIHKTEQKAVRLNISSLEHALHAFNELQRIPGFEGALVQSQIEGTELLIGSKNDIQFGPTLVFGLGGVLVELLKDISIRIPPITAKDALQMVREIKHQQVLQGFRGKPKVNEEKLVEILLLASKMIEKTKPLELDINPLMANEKGIWAVDARIVLK